ncbi:MAG: magnesium transporter CorA family protein [Lentisphaerae bacterium]|nr:magnesium transporter CorA family protein [Lentisphaerota bacterium]
MLRQYKLTDNRLVETGNGDGAVIVFINPDEAEKRRLLDEFKIDEHTLVSALDPDELARLEFEPDHAAMIYKRPRNYSSRDHFLFKVSSVGVFLFKGRLVIVSGEDLPLFDGRMFSRIVSLQDLVLRMIYRCIFHYLEHLRVINMITDSLERKIGSSMGNKYLLNLFTLEKSLVFYLSSINSNEMLIEKLRLNAAKIGFSPESIELLDDIHVENNQCRRQAEIYSNILASLMDARASIVGNNLNMLMKTLNIITISIMVPTLVVSVFSMNVDIPFDNKTGSPFGFWIIMAMALGSMFLFVKTWTYLSERNLRISNSKHEET